MALSKSRRILILLAIDTIFFLIEIVTGYTVHSLALVADSFHMLNDVLSLCVGLWAVKVANERTNSKQFTYGWQRAETLGALVNGVFLVALCVTIFLDAIQRFVEPQEVSQPKLVLIVGCLGFGSNMLGLVLFHDHGHSHGGGGHSHGGESAAEEGHAHSHDADHAHVADETGAVEDVLPQTRIAGYQSTHAEGSDTTAVEPASPSASHPTSNSRSGKQRKSSRSHSRVHSGFDDIYVSPNAFRNSIIQAGRMDTVESDEGTDTENVVEDDSNDTHDHSHQPLLNGNQSGGYGALPHRRSIDHKQHNHAKPKESGNGHGHSHGDLNMRGIFLHVMGDALGNIGVIATALVIWLCRGHWRFYFDPAISLVITVIILCSAIPLCKAASRILLQAVPAGMSIDEIKEDIEQLPGILGCHHLHVWQLSDTTFVASLHVQVDFEFKGDGSARYMQLAQAIRKCLHEYGIHSSTIQPEFCLDPEHDHGGAEVEGAQVDGSPNRSAQRPNPASRIASKAGSVRDADSGCGTCLLECDDNCPSGKGCCDLRPKEPKDGQGD